MLKHYQLMNLKKVLNSIVDKIKSYALHINKFHKTFSLYSIIIIFIFFTVIFSVTAYSLGMNGKPNFVTSNIHDLYKSRMDGSEFLVRYEINEIVEMQGVDDMVEFYYQFVGNRKITKIIILNAINSNIPINLAIAQAWRESRFNPRATSGENYDGSIDRGLYQLNDGVFNLTLEEFFNPEISANKGLNHLSEMIDMNDGSIIYGLYCYNAGYGRVIIQKIIPDSTLDYVQDILEYEDILNLRFNSWLREKKSPYSKA